MTRAEAGRIGGIQTLLRHGREHFSLAGQRGGRPKAMTLQQQPAPENLMNGGEAVQRPFSLKKLKELYRRRGECCN